MVVHEQLGPVEGRAFVSVPSNPSSWNHGKYCAISWRHREREWIGEGEEWEGEREGDMGNQRLD